MKTLLSLSIMLAGLAAQAAATGFSLERVSAAELRAATDLSLPAPSVAPVVPAQSSQLREWTIIAYLVGNDNNLERTAVETFNFLEFAGSSEKTAIVAELGRMKWQKPDDGFWQGSKRYYVERDTNKNVKDSGIISPALQTLPGADMGDYRHLAEFITWAKTNYPAKRYALFLHGHGSGWKDKEKNKGIAFDAASGNFITTPELGSALRLAGPVDIFYTIACVTQMAEVMYEVKDSVGYAIASEELNLAATSDQNGNETTTAFESYALAGPLVSNPELPTEILAGIIPEGIKRMWEGFGLMRHRLTFSVVKPGLLPELAARLDAWAAAAEALDDRNAAAAAKRAVLRFEQNGSGSAPNSNYADLRDFISLYAGAVSTTEPRAVAFRKQSAELEDFLTSKVVIKNISFGKRRDGADYARAGGLAITLPAYKPANIDARLWTYEDLAFAKESSWDRFIFKYMWNIDNSTGFTPGWDARAR
ncbi:MAG: clostripain-related cysteine peptidase [Elusimicrobiales bacterium]|nr:clostripain-related cysteine peptidase [Elusimicrobiales bacterium]